MGRPIQEQAAGGGSAAAEERLAVIVQCLINAQVTGVLFTANPLTGRREQAVIDAHPGLGEAVVAGVSDPDHFVADPRTGTILERRLRGKQLIIRPAGGVDGDCATSTNPLLRWWIMLLFAGTQSLSRLRTLQQVVETFAGAIGVVTIPLTPGTVALYRRRGVAQGGCYLVRPDLYIAYRSAGVNAPHLQHYLARFLLSARRTAQATPLTEAGS